jgi:hypothetical protein
MAEDAAVMPDVAPRRWAGEESTGGPAALCSTNTFDVQSLKKHASSRCSVSDGIQLPTFVALSTRWDSD